MWGTGIGVLGPVDAGSGRPVALPFLPGWGDHPARDRLEASFGVPVWVDNEVNLMALGEYRAGSDRRPPLPVGDPARDVPASLFPSSVRDLRVDVSPSSDRAGLIGAAHLVLDHLFSDDALAAATAVGAVGGCRAVRSSRSGQHVGSRACRG